MAGSNISFPPGLTHLELTCKAMPIHEQMSHMQLEGEPHFSFKIH